MAELLRKHPSLVSVELVEHSDRHLPTRAKDEIGRALLENKSRKLSFLHCDMCVRTFIACLPHRMQIAFPECMRIASLIRFVLSEETSDDL